MTDLLHRVAIEGTTVPDNFFTISYYPRQSEDEQKMITEQSLVSRHFLVSAYVHVLAVMHACLLFFQSQKDISKLVYELRDVTEFRTLGLYLGLKPAVLDVVEQENSTVADKKSGMFSRWLQSNTKAAWEDVVSALKKMENYCVAERIMMEYCDGGDTHASDLNKQSLCNTSYKCIDEISEARKRKRSHNETFGIGK